MTKHRNNHVFEEKKGVFMGKMFRKIMLKKDHRELNINLKIMAKS